MKKKTTSELGQRLQNLLHALGLQQKEMALAAGLNSGYLSDLISGKRKNPGIETILKIANTFNVNLNYLLLGEGEMFLPDKDEVLKKEKELKLELDNIDDLYRLMKKSNFVRNTVMGYASKVCIDNEATIRKENEKMIEKEKKKAEK
ncbi:MAG: helix-turn-helix transcriptional regulator [Candidatus Aminicenantes bacterium]|nr:MAG: helix-turn-helix transcriptional regulator [Candidatus Aminicenantes bacterium]